MKKLVAVLVSSLVSASAFAASSYEQVNRFFDVTSHASISAVSADEANTMYFNFCSSAGEFNYENNSSVSGSINFDGASDFAKRCNILNTARNSSAGKGIVCVGNTQIDSDAKAGNRIKIIESDSAVCGKPGFHKVDEDRESVLGTHDGIA